MKILTNDEVTEIWNSMPGGPEGWLKQFGYIQFAEEVERKVSSKIAPTISQKQAVRNAEDATRYRFLRNPNPSFDDFPPQHGACWVVQYSQSPGLIPEMRSAGFGPKLDATLDLEISLSGLEFQALPDEAEEAAQAQANATGSDRAAETTGDDHA